MTVFKLNFNADTREMRCILHSDLNNFYASVECVRNPSVADKPVLVCGDRESRHGIVLAKNSVAKSYGVKTGDVIWEARGKCDIPPVEIQADFKTYLDYSRRVKSVYEDFTDMIEPFGIDECWLDVTGCKNLFGDGVTIARLISERIKKKTGLTVSIGVSFNKIFAKLAGDIAGADEIISVTQEDFRDKIWGLPVEDLLYVGRATKKKLNRWGIFTIGELAQRDIYFLKSMLGKWGEYLHSFANGTDQTPVMKIDESAPVKSIGNSLTNYRDVTESTEVIALIALITDSVASRLRESGFGKAKTLHFHARDKNLFGYGKQLQLPYPSYSSADFTRAAVAAWREVVPLGTPIRGIGISVSGFTGLYDQMTLPETNDAERQEKAEIAVDKLRKKYGNGILKRGIIQTDARLAALDIKDDHVIHPENFFR